MSLYNTKNKPSHGMEAGSVGALWAGSAAPASGLLSDSGVSPVVGSVLVLVIAIVGITAVVMWGLPAISELRAGTELRAVLEQFQGLDGILGELVSGSARQATVRWTPSIEQGSVSVDQSSDRWIVAVNFTPADAPPLGFSIRYANASDRDNHLLLVNAGQDDVALATAKAWQIIGGIETELRVYRPSAEPVTTCGGQLASSPLLWKPRAIFNVTLCTNVSSTTPANLGESLVKLTLYNGSSVLETAWIGDMGWIHYQSSTGGSSRHVFAANGAILAGPLSGLVVQNDLPIPPPRSFTNASGGNATGLFIRLLRINGSASFSSGGLGARQGVFLTHYGTFRLAEQTNITAVKIYDFSDLREPWYRHLADTLAGYRFVRESGNAWLETNEYLVHQEGKLPFRFTLVHSVVTVRP